MRLFLYLPATNNQQPGDAFPYRSSRALHAYGLLAPAEVSVLFATRQAAFPNLFRAT